MNLRNLSTIVLLFCASVVFAQSPLRLRFMAYDLDKRDQNRSTFQINNVDLRQPSHFLRIGDMIPKTKLKIVGYKQVTDRDASGAETDASELTLKNIETNKSIVLTLRKIVDVAAVQ